MNNKLQIVRRNLFSRQLMNLQKVLKKLLINIILSNNNLINQCKYNYISLK
jgi:hypothetical protein